MAHFSHFKSHVESNLHDGTDCEGRESQYICSDALTSYWTPIKVNDILYAELGEEAARISKRTLTEHYFTVFSVLFYISNGRKRFVDEIVTFINSGIDDRRLPLTRQPAGLANDVWTLFVEHQWKFCPIRLGFEEYSRTRDMLDSRCVFPGIEVSPESIGKTELQGAGVYDAQFKYMELGRSPEGNAKAAQPFRYAVIKSYPASAKIQYDNETLFFSGSEQSRRPSPNIVRCLGYYSCSSETKITCNIILEYASKGSLDDFYQKETSPRGISEIRDFWKSFFTFLKGLEHMHNKEDGTASVHHDMQPANLLVFPGSQGLFDFAVKVCDFGLSTTKGKTKPPGPYREGSSTYSAPERSLADQVEYEAHPSADVFAASCIILEAAAWIRGGERGRQAFCDLREAEICNDAPGMFERGLGDSFHNGVVPLRCVMEAIDILCPDDPITSRVLAIVLEKVLAQMPEDRINAGDLFLQLDRAVSRVPLRSPPSSPARSTVSSDRKSPAAWRESTANGGYLSPPLDNHESGFSAQDSKSISGSTSSYQREENGHSTSTSIKPKMHSHRKSVPNLSFDQVRDWRKSGKKIPLPGREVVMKELKGRDHIFVIDNSESMQGYKSLLLDRLLPLAYILKNADPDDLEVMMTNDCEFAKFKSSTALQAHVAANFHKGQEVPTHMETCFEKLFDMIRSRLPEKSSTGKIKQGIKNKVLGQGSRRTNIYFLTDGAWAENEKEIDDGSLEDALRALSKDIESRGLDRRWISLQFIRFGHHPQGIEKLNYLDDFLLSQRDFIDHKPIDYSVWHLLVGPLMRIIDKEVT